MGFPFRERQMYIFSPERSFDRGLPHDSSGERRGRTPIRSGKSYACHRSPGLRFVKIIPVGYRSAPDTHSFRRLRIPSCKLNRLFVQRRLPWRDSSAENPMINHIRRSQRGRNCAVLVAALRREWLRADIGRALYKIVRLVAKIGRPGAVAPFGALSDVLRASRGEASGPPANAGTYFILTVRLIVCLSPTGVYLSLPAYAARASASPDASCRRGTYFFTRPKVSKKVAGNAIPRV